MYASKYIFLIDHHCKIQTEITDLSQKSQNLLKFLRGALTEHPSHIDQFDAGPKYT